MHKFVTKILNRIRKQKAEPSAALGGKPKGILVRPNPCAVPLPGAAKQIVTIRAGDLSKRLVEYAPDPEHRN